MEVRQPGTAGRIYTDSLIAGPAWAGTALTFSFPTAIAQFDGYVGDEALTSFEPLDAAQQGAVRSILASISGFTQLTFSELTGSGATQAVLRFGMTDDIEEDVAAFAYLPSPSPVGGDSWYRDDGYNDDPVRGNDPWHTFMHEIGHALGLGHPHEQDGGEPEMPSDRDTMPWTVMSYSGLAIDQTSWAQSYMIEDIAALQFLYGANFDHNGGDTIYRWDATTGEMSINGVGQGVPAGNRVFQTVWDGGGNDTYDLSSYAGATTYPGGPIGGVTIDLAPGNWSTLAGAQLPQIHGYVPGSIANALLYNGDLRSLIENAIGSSFDDILRGNEIVNTLQGGVGNDWLAGRGGDDVLLGGAGHDSLFGDDGHDRLIGGEGNDQAQGGAGNDYLEGGSGDDSIYGEDGADTLMGGDGDDRLEGGSGRDTLDSGRGNNLLYGGDGDDVLTGGDGNDVLDGEGGADRMIGGLGDDTYFIDQGGDQIVELAGQGTDTVKSSISYVMGEGIENVELDWFAAVDASVLGNSANNLIAGNFTNNVLDGGAGADTMTGLEGDDTYYVDDPDDLVYETEVWGIDKVYASVSYTLREFPPEPPPGWDPYAGASLREWSAGENQIEHLILLGSGDLSGVGNRSANTITGNGGDNMLDGMAGDDHLRGGGGDDTLVGGSGNDRLDGGSGTDTAVMTYAFAQSRFTVSDGALVIVSGQGERDVLLDIEKIEFVDGVHDAHALLASAEPDTGPPPLPIPGSEADFIMLAGSGWKGSIGGIGKIFGTTGMQDITILGAESEIALDASFNRGGDRINLPGNAATYRGSVAGAELTIDSQLDGPLVRIPVGLDELGVNFADGVRGVAYDPVAQAITVGSQAMPAEAITSAPETIGSEPTDPAAFARAILFEHAGISLAGNYQVFGSLTADRVETEGAGRYEFDASFNSGLDRITLDHAATEFTARLDGSKAILSAEGLTLSIPIGTAGMILDFDGDERTLRVDAQTGIVWLGGDAIDAGAAQLEAALMNSAVV